MQSTPHSPKRIGILFAGRFPSEKAAGLFVDLNARSFAEKGVVVTVVASRRLGRSPVGDVPYKVVYAPTIDLSRIPGIWSIANYISVFCFSVSAFLWLLFKTGTDDLLISNDALPLLLASFARGNTMYEMHDFAIDSFVYRVLLKRVRYVLVTNEWKRGELVKRFAIPNEKIIVERNAVDTRQFGRLSVAHARRELALDLYAKFVVYTGHLYEWKGADTLAHAAALVPEAEFVFVGGALQDVERFSNRWKHQSNIRIVGHVPHEQAATWQSAADVLVLPNSGKEEISVHYTSPMKLFEYMASGRPIVASDLPSIREVLTDKEARFAEADNAESLAGAIRAALFAADERPLHARAKAETYSWSQRAERILSRII